MNLNRIKKKFIGNKSFYTMVFMVAIPIMIQNGITNLASLIDNIMVGRLGTNEMSAVAIINQLLMVFILCVFGGVAGAGIFTAQFFGAEDEEGVKYTFRYKLVIISIITIIGTAILLCFGEDLISLYLKGDTSGGDMAYLTLKHAKSYLSIIILGLPAISIVIAYGDTLRRTGETIAPMRAGIISVLVNLALNYILIYGTSWTPAYGVFGAGVATVIARYIELLVIVFWVNKHRERFPFIKGVFKNFRIPLKLTKEMILKGMPLVLNETMWSMGVAALIQSYSMRGILVVGAMNISQTIINLFNVALIAMGDSIAIILGQRLGAGKLDKAREYSVKLIFFTEIMCVGIAFVVMFLAPIFPMFYNTTGEIKELATTFIRIAAIGMPIFAFETCCYFTIRSGGKTFITFLFDSVFMCTVLVPVSYLLITFTELNIANIYLIIQLVGLIKCLIGYIFVKKGIWIKNIT